MNKNVKGAIAVGAGALLLLGGGGTFALWNASSTLGDSTVASGELDLDSSTVAAGEWHLYDPTLGFPAGVGADITSSIDDGSYNIQPGTSIVYVVDGFKIEVEGSNLYYTFSSDLGAEDGDNGGYTTSVVTSGSALPGSQLTSGNFTSTVTGPITASTDLPVYHYTSGTQSAATTFNGGLVVNFDADDEDSFDSVLDLDGFNFVLAQVLAV